MGAIELTDSGRVTFQTATADSFAVSRGFLIQAKDRSSLSVELY